MVHVLLSMFKPLGNEGVATQEVAPVTLFMPPLEPLPEPPLEPLPEPPLEPLLSPVEESQVLLPETTTGEV